jgi:transposase
LPAATKRRLLELFVLGVPVYRQRFRSPASRPAIERFYRIVRAVLALAEDLREPFAGKLECDETTFGGAKKGKRGWGAAGKVIQAHSGAEVLRCIGEHTTPGSLYYTDEWQAYVSLRLRGDHVVIRKEKGRPMGRDHITGAHIVLDNGATVTASDFIL